jgi:hypothetical protein
MVLKLSSNINLVESKLFKLKKLVEVALKSKNAALFSVKSCKLFMKDVPNKSAFESRHRLVELEL